MSGRTIKVPGAGKTSICSNEWAFRVLILWLTSLQLCSSFQLIVTKQSAGCQRTFGCDKVLTFQRISPLLFDKQTKDDDVLAEQSNEGGIQKDSEPSLQDDLALFSFDSYDPSNVDFDQLPVPMFTSLLITGASLVLWGYVFYIAIVGIPADTDTSAALPSLISG